MSLKTRINQKEIDVANKVKQIIIDQLNDNMTILLDDTDLRTVIALDDLDLMTIAMEIEDEFGIEFPDCDMDEQKTVGDIIDYVINKVRAK